MTTLKATTAKHTLRTTGLQRIMMMLKRWCCSCIKYMYFLACHHQWKWSPAPLLCRSDLIGCFPARWIYWSEQKINACCLNDSLLLCLHFSAGPVHVPDTHWCTSDVVVVKAFRQRLVTEKSLKPYCATFQKTKDDKAWAVISLHESFFWNIYLSNICFWCTRTWLS